MPRVLTVSGSPSATSRTADLIRYVGHRVAGEGHDVRHLAVRELPAAPLLHADTRHRAIKYALRAVAESDALVLGTPVYKAAYSGMLKTFLDLLPQQALAGKSVLPLATGGSTAHVLALDYALRPVLTSLGADRVLRGWFVLDRHLTRKPGGGLAIASETAAGLTKAVDGLRTELSERTTPADVPASAGLSASAGLPGLDLAAAG